MSKTNEIFNRTDHLGVKDRKLAPCPNTPNCVSSQSHDLKKLVSPMPLKCGVKVAKQFIKYILAEYKNATTVVDEPVYMRVEFRSSIFKFVDDVEFYFDEEGDQIHFRSASRRGRADFGVNRKRMKEITLKFTQCIRFYNESEERKNLQ